MVRNVQPWTNSTDSGSINSTQFFSALGTSVRKTVSLFFTPSTYTVHKCRSECALFMLTALLSVFTARENKGVEREKKGLQKA